MKQSLFRRFVLRVMPHTAHYRFIVTFRGVDSGRGILSR
jgi:hypothetical protein